MYSDFIGKNVAIKVGFSVGYADGGAVPRLYFGKILDANDKFVRFSTIENEEYKVNGIKYNSGEMIINPNYIISVCEIMEK